MNDTEVTLPRSGGKAWLRTRLSDERVSQLEDARMLRLPKGAMAAMYKGWEDGSLARDCTDEVLTRYLVARGFTGPEVRQASKETDRATVRIVVRRWVNVRGPEDDTDLEFPDGIPDLDPDDFDFLLLECLRAIDVGRADPKDSGGRSPSTFEQGNGTNGSHATFETPSDSMPSTEANLVGAGER